MGTQAPDFNLPATPDQRLRLSELRGKPVVLVFYPADWSPVCGDELALFNEALPLIKPKQALVLGISVDSAWCHQAFRDARKLHFDLLSDYEPRACHQMSQTTVAARCMEPRKAMAVLS